MRPMSFRHILPALAMAATAVAPLTAHAAEGDEEDPYPIVYGQRPITLNGGASSPHGAFTFNESGIEGADTAIGLRAGFDYGIMKNLQAGVEMPFLLSPESDAGNPRLHGRYRFLRGATPIELGVELGATFPVQDNTDFGLDLGLLAKYQINDAAQLRFGAFVDFLFADETITSLTVPVSLAISFTRNIFFQLDTGLRLFDFDLLSVPLGVSVGYTLAKTDDEPLGDIYLGFSFPTFISSVKTIDLTTGEESSESDVNTDAWQVILGARFFL